MTNLEIAKDQLELALQEIKNTLTVEQGELIYDYVFEALKQVKNCSIPDVVGRSEQLVCDCGDSKMTWYGNDDDKKWFCFNCKKEAS